jgi:NADH-quinone oxidoreductase subunit H
VNRAPFDLAEAESELVAGFHTEYSGLRWSLFFMAEYGSMFLVSGLAVILFFGGSNGPIPVGDWLGKLLGGVDGSIGANLPSLGAITVGVIGVANFILKGVIGVVVMIWIRWTFPRLRIDQVMSMCLKYCVPIAAFCFIGAVGWEVLDLPTPTNLDGKSRYEYHEKWSQEYLKTQRQTKPVENDAHAHQAIPAASIVTTVAVSQSDLEVNGGKQ